MNEENLPRMNADKRGSEHEQTRIRNKTLRRLTHLLLLSYLRESALIRG